MSLVSISFQDVTITETSCLILVTNGQIFTDASNWFRVSAEGLTEVAHDPGAASFMVATNTGVSAYIDLPITSGQEPVVQVNNFAGTVIIYWLATSGPVNQLLEPGNPMTLSDFVS